MSRGKGNNIKSLQRTRDIKKPLRTVWRLTATTQKNKKEVIALYTDYGYIGKIDGILYSTIDEALEANPRN